MRHIKCDETPGACKNCTSTGRSCAYDLQRLPRCGKSKSTIKKDVGNQDQIVPEVADGLRWAITSDERRCFSYFKYHTIPTLQGLCDSPLWQELVLRMSLSEPAVYHAVVALSAVHQDSEIYGMPLPGQIVQNTWHQFSLEQCGRSFAILNRRHASQDPQVKEVMLLCCLLFVLMELLRGQYDDAFKHLHSGLRIIRETRAQTSSDSPVDTCLVEAFTNLGIQSAQFGSGELLTDIYNEIEHHTYPTDGLRVFCDLSEARQAFDPIVADIFPFLARIRNLSEEAIASEYGTLLAKQLQFISQLYKFGHCFESFCSYRRFSPKQQRGVDMIRIMHRTLSLAVKTFLLRGEIALDFFTPEFETHLSLVEEILGRFSERPSFTLEIGILPALYYAALQCPDYRVRSHAVELLQSWPHREGTFDSNWIVFLALERMKAESVIESDQNIISYMRSQSSEEKNGRKMLNNYSLEDALSSTRCMRSWPCVQYVHDLRSGKIA